jgi:two-component system chemotaxis response regulator CheB
VAAGAHVTDPIRVLVVDDSVVIRRVVSRVIEEHPDLELAGVAANGAIALQKIEQVHPDVVTLDIEMPDMDGLTALGKIRETNKRLPIIMCSTLTARGATATLDALSKGATDYVTKPSTDGLEATLERLREDLVPKLLALGRGRRPSPTAPLLPRRPAAAGGAAPARPAQPPARVEVVIIGVSTGGPNALAELIPALPADLGVPVLIVQHMPPVFTGILSQRLDAQSALTVREAAGGSNVEPGDVWIAAGDHHMLAVREGLRVKLEVNQGPPENSCRPAADVLFRSAAATWGRGVLAVVLTGMGSDGLRGCEVVQQAGGRIIVQDADTSVVWGMPGYVAQAGLAEAVLPLGDVAGEIVQRVKAGRPLAGAVRRP